MNKYVVTVLIMLFSMQAYAVNTWYYGPVTQIITYQDDGSFMVYLDNPVIQDVCAYKRVVFSVANMGAERTKAALSMAMAAFVSGKKFGVVIDLPVPGSVCAVPSAASQGAGIM